MKRQHKDLLIKIGFFVFLLFVWQIVFSAKIWPSWVFPSPLNVWQSLIKSIHDHSLTFGILISLKRLFIGFIISILLGGLIGVLVAKFRLCKITLGSLILGLQTLPSICWLPLSLLWFGLNEKAIIFVIIMGSILSVSLAVENGIKNIPRIYLKAGKILGASKYKMYHHVIFPAMLPNFLGGLKQAWSFAWRSLMSGEMLFITVGLGQLLMMGRELNDMSRVLAIMIVIIVIGLFFDKFVFGKLEKNVLKKWGLYEN